MPFVIGAACLNVLDQSCVEECPVDCIYVGARKLYINPTECIECGACEAACPVQAISLDRRTPPEDVEHIADNAAFFTATLRGRAAPLGDPGGAAALGPVGVDTELVERMAQAD